MAKILTLLVSVIWGGGMISMLLSSSYLMSNYLMNKDYFKMKYGNAWIFIYLKANEDNFPDKEMLLTQKKARMWFKISLLCFALPIFMIFIRILIYLVGHYILL